MFSVENISTLVQNFSGKRLTISGFIITEQILSTSAFQNCGPTYPAALSWKINLKSFPTCIIHLVPRWTCKDFQVIF